jgi:peroxiredoxin
LSAVQQVLDQIQAQSAEVYAISIDSQFVQQAFATQNALAYPLLADPNRQATAAFGVLLPEVAGILNVSNRAVFVFGPDSRLIYQWLKDATDQPPMAQVLAALQG